MRKLRKLILTVLPALMGMTMLASMASMKVSAASDPVIVVSMGDSYSSGESIEPFYGQSDSIDVKRTNPDWLGHRSQNSWGAQIVVPGVPGQMSDYKGSTGDVARWYFTANSGAVTKNISKEKQKKFVRWYTGWGCWDIAYPYLDKQINVFNNIEGSVDYVTMTMGGNDVKFSSIIKECVLGSTWFGTSDLEDMMDDLWDNFDATRANIKQTYYDIAAAAGSQAAIIIVDYPKLLENNGAGKLMSELEAKIVNVNVLKFDLELIYLVQECQREGLNIHWVDVSQTFDGHEAYSSDPWINPVIFGAKDQELDSLAISSDYSMHPNATGAQKYASLVNAKIAQIEASKVTGSISGKVCKAANRTSPVANATITVYKGDTKATSFHADASGNYTVNLKPGEYRVVISADGYIDFTVYATVEANYNTYMETFLLIEGSPEENGTASGYITSATTGQGVNLVKLSVRSGWNNAEYGDVLLTTYTGNTGNYSLTLPLGNYTLVAEKDGYISSTVNIIVQNGSSESQNGSITPILSGDDYRIVLTWGENPRDMDSHLEGRYSDGSRYHVYYSNKSARENQVEICNLDVDDRYSYGPETITLTVNNEGAYYYYVHRYTGSGTTASSESKVAVYQGGTLVATYNVPTNLGDGDYWNVFAIKNGQIIPQNTITYSPSTSYAE